MRGANLIPLAVSACQGFADDAVVEPAALPTLPPASIDDFVQPLKELGTI